MACVCCALVLGMLTFELPTFINSRFFFGFLSQVCDSSSYVRDIQILQAARNANAVGLAVRLKRTQYIWVHSHELLPRKCWKLVFLASEWIGVFSKIYPELFPASPGAQLQENCRQHFSDPSGSNTITILDRIEKNNVFLDPTDDCDRIWPSWIGKVLTVISCNGAPGEAGSSSG